MCGIAAMFKASGIGGAERKLLEQMSERIAHRGPDGYGYFYTSSLGLAHRRLSILDVSEQANQPMSYIDRYTIIYNGEIYNYIEIKKYLEKRGYSFRTTSDTEVIMAAYDYMGTGCFSKFNGMWAVCLYDKKENELIVSRDRYGVKPLYYYKAEGYFILASEIKSLLCDFELKRTINRGIVYDYLKYGFIDHTENTFFEKINKFPAGTYMKLNLYKADDWRFQRYYDVKFSEEYFFDGDEKELCRKFRHIFTDSVKKRLRSDVVVGSCLSGGLDSSSIVTSMSELLEGRPGQLNTFSFCPQNEGISEKIYVDEVVKDKNIRSNIITEMDSDIDVDFNRLIDVQDEPFSSLSIYASWLVYKRAGNKGIKVLLDGQGADEVLCGYRKSLIYMLKKLFKERYYGYILKESILIVKNNRFSVSKEDVKKIRRILGRNDKEAGCYLRSGFIDEHSHRKLFETDSFQDLDVKRISLPILLRYADRNSMAASVESRLPFLDYRLVDFCAELPLSMKIHNGRSKYIMRKSLKMPEKVRKRKQKIGFSVPEKSWLKNNKTYFVSLLKDDAKSNEFLDICKIRNDYDEIVEHGDIRFLFRVICLESWIKHYDVVV